MEPTFVKSPLYQDKGVEYFASNVELGSEGVKKIHPVGQLSEQEQKLIEACLAEFVLFGIVPRSELISAGCPRTSRRARSLSRHKNGGGVYREGSCVEDMPCIFLTHDT